MSLTPEEWKAKLSEEEHRVMRENGTERPHTSEFNAEWRDTKSFLGSVASGLPKRRG